MYYGARYYDPALARFITADTVYDAGPQGLNRYSYALNNPIRYNDPSGHLAIMPTWMQEFSAEAWEYTGEKAEAVGEWVVEHGDEIGEGLDQVGLAMEVTGGGMFGQGGGMAAASLVTTAVSGGTSLALTGPTAIAGTGEMGAGLIFMIGGKGTRQLGKTLKGGKEGTHKKSLPEWLKERFRRGKDFDRAHRGRYKYNEVEVTVNGNKYKVDSYNPGKEIVSRRRTQLADVKEKTAIGYLQEFTRKYSAGAEITNSPFNPKALRGGRLSGDLIFEVPSQNRPISQTILDAATERGITIRDITGRIYN